MLTAGGYPDTDILKYFNGTCTLKYKHLYTIIVINLIRHLLYIYFKRYFEVIGTYEVFILVQLVPAEPNLYL